MQVSSWAGVVSDIDGACARKMVEGLIAGSTPEQLSALGRGKLKSTGEVLEAVATTSPQASARAARPATATRKVKKLKRQRPRSLIHEPDSGSADLPAYSWGDQWRRR
jgi:hypothetical protein